MTAVKGVEEVADVDVEGAGLDPGEVVLDRPEAVLVFTAVGGGDHREEQGEADDGRGADAEPDGPVGLLLEVAVAEEAGEDRAEQGEERDQVRVLDLPELVHGVTCYWLLVTCGARGSSDRSGGDK
jgi:hypothetical protein